MVVGVTVAVIGIIAIASMTDYKEGKKKKKKEKEKSKTAKKLKPVSHSARVQCHCLVEQCMEAQSRKQVSNLFPFSSFDGAKNNRSCRGRNLIPN